jgi:carboxylesterase type B
MAVPIGRHRDRPRVFGDRLAAQGDLVVVTVNHRLNALGYLYLAGWTRASPTAAMPASST